MYIRARDSSRLTFEVPEKLHRELQIFTAKNNIFMKDCIVEALEYILKNKKKFSKRVDTAKDLMEDVNM